MSNNLIGLDIGGTKCAVTYGVNTGADIMIRDKIRFITTNVEETLHNILNAIDAIVDRNKLQPGLNGTDGRNIAIGISCGGPLDSEAGIVLSPPNLPGWDRIKIVEMIEERFQIKTAIHNDANASALAEWKFGAGIGCKNMAYLTCSTGLGSGLILNGQLYTGTNDNAGELGHIRLSQFGPVGYGKIGSFEGFASGGGIAQLARDFLKEKFQMGEKISWCTPEQLGELTAHNVAIAAAKKDPIALGIYKIVSQYLGRGLAMVIDLLNPELIVIGGIYTRNQALMEPIVMEEIQKEALGPARVVCKIQPSALGEEIGDYASLSVALNAISDVSANLQLKR